jgi:hypothetical protein
MAHLLYRRFGCRLINSSRHAGKWFFSTHTNEMDYEKEPRESMPFDVLIVGGGPAGLAASIRIKQLCSKYDTDLSVCLIDKGR